MFKIANILTGFNLLFGVISILLAFSGRLELAVIAILIGAILDFFDGFVARILKQQGELGKQLDSLADIVTFGVAPGIIVFVLLILSGATEIIIEQGGKAENLWLEGTMGHSVHFWISVYFNDLAGNQSGYLPTHFYGIYKFIPFVGLIIPFFSLFRLAKFNLDIRQTTGFIGLPTPANSLFFASFALMLWDGFQLNNWKTFISTYLIQPSILIPLVVLFSLLLIAEIPLFSLKFKDFSWKNNKIRFIFLLFAIICIAALWVWAIPIIIILYILMSILNR
ncbi:MAG: CDP-alcohol phosphatidyltransferase family protein [Brumimicrobium sp.]